jgi:hypothetical protein
MVHLLRSTSSVDSLSTDRGVAACAEARTDPHRIALPHADPWTERRFENKVGAPRAWLSLLPRAARRIFIRRAWTISRVLFRSRVAPRPAKIIHLGAVLPRRSSTLTRALRTTLRSLDRAGRPRQCPYSSLLREGLASPPVTRLSRVGSYPTISPLPVQAGPCEPAAIGGVISVALSLGSPRVGVTDFPALWSPDFPPADDACPPAISRPPPTRPEATRVERDRQRGGDQG